MGELNSGKPSSGDGKTKPGLVPTVAPQIPVGNLAQAIKTAGVTQAAAIVVAQTAGTASAGCDATQAVNLLVLQYLRNYGGMTVN